MAINYWCPNSEERSQCDRCDNRGHFQSNERIEDLECSINCGVKTKIMGETCNAPITTKMTPQQVQKERRQRSSDHFKKDILPTLGTAEKIHHALKKPQ